MVKYKLIIEYYQKGNNNSQIATLCGCSRTVVWEVLNRFNKIETKSKGVFNEIAMKHRGISKGIR